MKKLFILLFSFLFFTQLTSNDLIWTSPVTLSTPMVNASDPQIVMDPLGNTTAVWVENSSVKASFQPVLGSWGPPVVLSVLTASSPRLGVGASGNVTAVWLEGGVVMSSTLPLAGSWGIATALSGAGALPPEMAVRSNGDAVVVWSRSGFIESTTKLFGGNWGLVSMISGANSDNPHVAVGDNGTVVAVWHNNGTAHVVQSSSKTISGAWTTPKQLIQVSSAYNHNYPRVSVDPDGNADAVWYRYQYNDGNYINVVVFASSLPLGAAGWSPIPTYLTTTPGIRNPADLKARITHDSSGNAMALWSMSYDNSTFILESALKLLGQIWTTSTVLSQSEYSFTGDISANSLGGVVGAYMDFDGSSVSIQAAEANISGVLPDVFWSQPVEVSVDTNNAYPKVVSAFIGNEVHATAIWLSSVGGNIVTQAATGSRITIAPPTNLAVQQDVINFGVFSDYYNTITWNPSIDPNVVGYTIYRNGVLFEQVNPITFMAIEHNAVPNGPVTYGVAAVDNQGGQSQIVSVNFP